ncbi:MAG: hypothetical protein AAGE59_21710 [Cyanobacteria bacterium P01_F01_bin.86]
MKLTNSTVRYSKAHKLPLRLVLLGPFLLPIFAAVGLTGYFSLQNGARAVNDRAEQLKAEIDNRIDPNLTSFFAVGPAI